MNKIILHTKRGWNWKVFLVLAGLNIMAVFAYQLYQRTRPDASTSADSSVNIVMIIEYVACVTVGLILANRIGLGLPFVEGWAKHEPAPMSFRKVVAIAWIIGVCVGVLLLTLSIVVFGPAMQAMFKELGITSPNVTQMSPLSGLMASFYAGITEETLCRLAGLTLIAWMGSLLFHRSDGRPKLGIFWLANILLALIFGFGHLQTAAGMGWPLNSLVVTRGLLLNGIAGLAFGWLYWSYGFESAMMAHFFADIIAQVVYPFIATWQGEPAKSVVISGVGIVILLSLIWAVRSLMRGRLKRTPDGVLKAA